MSHALGVKCPTCYRDELLVAILDAHGNRDCTCDFMGEDDGELDPRCKAVGVTL